MSDLKKIPNELIEDAVELMSSFKSDNFYHRRTDAFEAWKSTPAPTTRDEYWKYTRLNPILKKTYSVDKTVNIDVPDIDIELDVFNLVFVNGVYSKEHSDVVEDGDLIISDLNYAKEIDHSGLKNSFSDKEDQDYFSLLNDAFHLNGPFIHVGKNVTVEKIIRIKHIITDEDRLVNIKGIIIGEENSSFKILESWDHESSSNILINSKNNIHIKEGASCEIIKIQSIGNENSLIDQGFIQLERNAKSTVHTISMDGQLIRNNLNASLIGEGGECYMNGLYMTNGKQHIDNHTKVIHAVPNCYSNELYKGILNDSSQGVFNGKVIVEKYAQKTNAFQFNGNILLSDNAQINSKPELEIYADDVKCSHGSTIGQLDQEALFYLESRGIQRDNARNLLVYAFAKEVLEKISVPELRSRIDDYLTERYHIVKDA